MHINILSSSMKLMACTVLGAAALGAPTRADATAAPVAATSWFEELRSEGEELRSEGEVSIQDPDRAGTPRRRTLTLRNARGSGRLFYDEVKPTSFGLKPFGPARVVTGVQPQPISPFLP